MKTRAAVLWEIGAPWKIEEIELDPPKHGEVLVRMVAAGLCHSDYHFNTADIEFPTPLVGGHEGAGVVEELGPGVEGLEVGDHVITTFIPSCGHCRWCVEGRGRLCDRGAAMMDGTALDGTHRLRIGDVPGSAMAWTGTFAEHSVAPARSLVKIAKDVPLESVVLVSCGVPTGWGSAVNVAAVKPGETVVVIGAGGVGMNAVQGAAYAGAMHTVAVEPVAWKREKALSEFGATHAVASLDDAAPLLAELTSGAMADKAILHVGLVDGEMIQSVAALVSKGGVLTISAVPKMTQTDAKLSLYEFVLSEKQLRGALYGGSEPHNSIGMLVELYRLGKLKLDEMITGTYALEDINQGYRDMIEGRNLRGVVVFDR
jgi:S-(hydroxymethyl)glutathione dehydrogenase/alcohol dehydrogenase